jgi:hypothetical protein
VLLKRHLRKYQTKDYMLALLTPPVAENVQLLSTYKPRDYRPALLTLPLAKGELEGVPTSSTAYPNHQTYPQSWTFSAKGELEGVPIIDDAYPLRETSPESWTFSAKRGRSR